MIRRLESFKNGLGRCKYTEVVNRAGKGRNDYEFVLKTNSGCQI